MLEINHINVFYGKVQCLWDLSLKVEEAEIVALVGANGAGKTTLLNTVCGLMRPSSGSITFLGNSIDGLMPHLIVELGLAHIPESGRIFPDMTVGDNLDMGAYPLRSWRKRNETLQQVYQTFPRLAERGRQLGRTLSGGEKQMLAMGRGLMSRPALCMFDEPSYGLAPKMVLEVFRIINSLREQGIAVLLVEQNVRHTLEIADRAYVLENGRVVSEGAGAELLESDYVRKAYLGL
jgi:branched-chain amino acid transport system ATP-binding protein